MLSCMLWLFVCASCFAVCAVLVFVVNCSCLYGTYGMLALHCDLPSCSLLCLICCPWCFDGMPLLFASLAVWCVMLPKFMSGAAAHCLEIDLCSLRSVFAVCDDSWMPPCRFLCALSACLSFTV